MMGLLSSLISLFFGVLSGVIILIICIVSWVSEKKRPPQPSPHEAINNFCPMGEADLSFCPICHLHDHCFPEYPIHKDTPFDYDALWSSPSRSEGEKHDALPDILRLESPDDLFNEPDYHDTRYDDLLSYEEGEEWR